MKKFFMFVVLLVSILAPQLVSAQTATIATVPNPAIICAGQGTVVSLTATGSGGLVIGYAWSNGGNTQAINVSPGATTTYTVTVTFLGGATANANQAVTVVAAPSQATITPTGPTTVCTGNTVQLDASIADSWQWYVNGGPIPGATSQSYIANASGNYTVMGTIGNCTTPMSNPTTVNIIPLPTANVTPAGPLTTCYGTPIVLTADPVPGATYQWQYSINGMPPWSNILGETNQTYNATVSGFNRIAVTIGACVNYSN